MNPHIFVAVPVYGCVPVGFMQAMMKLEMEASVNISIRFGAGDSLVSRARNSLTAQFLKTDCTHLLFIDSDLIFDAGQVKRLLAHDKDVAGGFYPKKQDGAVQWVCNGKENTGPDESGLIELRYIGTGFMLIKRAVIESMITRYGDSIAFHPDDRPADTEWDIWQVGCYKYPDGFVRHLSEDWYFCQRWLDMGGTVWGDTRLILKHIGQAVYPMRHQLHELIAKPTQADASDTASAAEMPSRASALELETQPV